jgi:ADP-heptose:LPS heptosyltransferase
LDSAGDVLLAGPAVRAVAAAAREVLMLVGPLGVEAARSLPGVASVHVWTCPWVVADPPRTDGSDIDTVVTRIRELRVDEAIIFTSFHQSPLPTALVLRLAGVERVAAISTDYPGSLLDVRHRVDDDIPEAQRGLSLAAAAGYPAVDDGRLAVRHPLPDVAALVGAEPYVVVHPGTSVPARQWPPALAAAAVTALAAEGRRVVVTGGPGERSLTHEVAGAAGIDVGGGTSFVELAAVLERAEVVVVANTGPAHLAAAVGTPVVSLFAPTVPAERWAPYGVPVVLLGDQVAACRDSRARECPVPGHPCLASVTVEDVVAAVDKLTAVGT